MNKLSFLLSAISLGGLLLAACQTGSNNTPQSSTTEKTLYIGPELVDCVGVAPQKCMQVKETPDGEYQDFYDPIQGFTFEPGYNYVLRVQVERLSTAPSDASSLKFNLIEVVEKTAIEATSTPPASINEADLSATTWEMVNYLDSQGQMQSGLSGTTVTAEFTPDGRISGSSGCNSYSAGYTLDGQQISIELPASTLMACADPEGVMEQEQAYLADLPISATYAIEDGSLMLRDAAGALLARFQPLASPPLQDVSWTAISYSNGKGGVVSLLSATTITAQFSGDGTLSGSAGCNSYHAPFTVDGSNLQIGPVASTRMACADPAGVMEQEGAYLEALGKSASYKISGDKLEIRDAEGALLANYLISTEADFPSPTLPSLATEADPRLQALRNATYPSEFTLSKEATLVNGEYREEAAPGSASQVVVQYTHNTVLGNLSDGHQVAVVILATNSGGSGTFFVLYLMDLSGSAPAALASNMLGDRVIINQVELQGDQITVDMVNQGPTDSFASPTQHFRQSYIYQDGELVVSESSVLGKVSTDELPLLGVTWQWVKTVTPVEEIQVAHPENYSLRFLPGGSLLVDADCNSGQGSYTVDGTALTFGSIAMTLMACEPDSQDAEFLKELDAAALYFMDGPSLMIDLFADSGTMTFQRP